uniref:Glycosyltransferase family 92 protein n=1 Tax=Opuntia streptacantha TaxID=393608 RepID=A0A7C9D369_OPUST
MKDQRAEKEKERGAGGGIRGGSSKGEGRVLFGFIWRNCAAELKLFVVAALLLCCLATILQFLPATFSLSSCSLCSCLPSTAILLADNSPTMPPPSRPSPLQTDQLLENGTLKRSFNPVGTGAYSFIFMSAYRGGAATFSVIGLASKPLHVFGHPTYTCEYRTTTNTSTVPGIAILPDWGFGRVYTTVVITCTFPKDSAATDSAGGRLLVFATASGGFDTQLNVTDTIEVLVEPANSWNASQFTDPPKYDYLYCGSPLYGNLSPQRVREWMAYHVRLFGRRSHFVIYDAGGVHPDVMKVLKPWMELGYLSLHDIREQERFDGYYHNQFLVVNDCLHRYRFWTKWMFFFDVDEYIYVDPKSNDSLRSVISLYETFTQITISQMLMSSKLCRAEDAHGAPKEEPSQ